MIIGEEILVSKEDLNMILVLKERFEGPGSMVSTKQPYHVEATLDEITKKYNGSDSFREQCLKVGYVLTSLYPVYHQGWEMDEWAANATKDGKEWWLTTNHGSLEAEEIPSFSLIGFIKSFFRRDMVK